MQKRYQIFVSSTFDDLKEERSKVITALLDLGHIPCGMEYFPASDEDAWNCIARLIPECDYYIVLVAGRYGSIAAGDNRSYTHKEYELAVASQVPVLGLLHRNPENLAKKFCENDPKAQRKLQQFRQLVQKRLCRYWSTPDQIPGELLGSLTHQINRFPRVGWVRADAIASDEAKSEIIDLRKTLEKSEKMVSKLQKARADQENELASGGDELRLFGKIKNYSYSNLEMLRKALGSERQEIQFSLVSDWNQLMRFGKDRSFLDRGWHTGDLEHWLSSEVGSAVRANPNWSKKVGFDSLHIHWDSGEIEKVTNQLLSLGLIVKRSYPEWAFTQKGILLSSRQMALRKGELRPGDLNWCRIEFRVSDKA